MQSVHTNNEIEKAQNVCLKKFLYYFRKGYKDAKYISWEREYKWNAHLKFQEDLHQKAFAKLIRKEAFEEIASTVVKIESRTNLLFSFEKMALRDAVQSAEGAKNFSIGLYDYVYGKDSVEKRFERFVKVIALLPRKQTRVLTWPLVTVFGFIADPTQHMFLKPRVTQAAAEKYNYDFKYTSKPNWETYKSLLSFAEVIRKDTKSYEPKDYIDLQSFMWVMGSAEYPD